MPSAVPNAELSSAKTVLLTLNPTCREPQARHFLPPGVPFTGPRTFLAFGVRGWFRASLALLATKASRASGPRAQLMKGAGETCVSLA